MLPQPQLAEIGFALVLYANTALQAAVKAMGQVLGTLRRDGDLNAVRDRLADFEERQRVVDKATFDALLAKHRVRPTVLSPFWSKAGFALGAATALLGERAAMACTVAVEEVIGEHYAHQVQRLEELAEGDEALAATLTEFRDDELEHRDTGLAHDAEGTPGYGLLSAAIKRGTRTAIWLSERF